MTPAPAPAPAPTPTPPTFTWPRLAYVAAAGATLLALAHAFAAVLAAGHALLLGFFAVLVAFILDIPISFLSRFMRRPYALLITALLLVGFISLLVLAVLPALRAQGAHLALLVPTALERAEDLFAGLGLSPQLRQELFASLTALVPLAFSSLAVVGAAFVVLTLALFLAYDPRSYLDGVVWLLPHRHATITSELAKRLSRVLHAWTVGTAISMLIIFALSALALWLLDLDSWLVLATIAGIGEFVPYVGPLAAALPAIAVGLAESPMKALYVALVFVAIQQAEGQILQPIIMKRAIRLQPAVLIVGQLVLLSVFGLMGVLVATPLLAVLQVVLGYLWVERFLGKTPSAPSA